MLRFKRGEFGKLFAAIGLAEGVIARLDLRRRQGAAKTHVANVPVVAREVEGGLPVLRLVVRSPIGQRVIPVDDGRSDLHGFEMMERRGIGMNLVRDRLCELLTLR